MERKEENCLFFKVIYQVVSNTFSISNEKKLETLDCQI